MLQRSLVRLLAATAMLFAVAAPSVAGLVKLRVDESKSPFEAGHEFERKLEEGLLNSPRRLRLPAGQRKPVVGPDRDLHSHAAAHSPPFHAADGHRLPNGLPAPLTC